MNIHLLLFQEAAGGASGLIWTILPFAFIFAIFYFLVIVPQKKQKQQLQEMIAQLKINDEVVTNGGINLNQRSTWNGSGATRSLHFLSAYPGSGSPSCPTQNITLANLTGFNAQAQVSVYSPCTVTMNNNNSAFTGQVVGGTLSVGNNFSMNFRPVLIPGSNITSFKEDLAYIREVVNS